MQSIYTEEKSRNVHIVQCGNRKSAKFLLLSDLHWDNPHTNLGLLKKHLEEAKQNNIKVFINGDLFCAMQGKYDKRKSKSDLRPEHKVANYLDALVYTAVDWFLPYADIIEVVGTGNHETAILRNHETNLTQRFVERLNTMKDKNDSKVFMGGYGGWIVPRFELAKNGGRLNYKIKYMHGYGGGGPVTKGTIQFNRMSTYISGADAIWMGHTHDDYELPYIQEYLSQNWTIKQREMLMIRTPSYKDEYADGYGGFHIERGRPPKPIGGRWLEVFIGFDPDWSTRYLKGITTRTL